MKKTFLLVTLATLVTAFFITSANASRLRRGGALEVNVACNHEMVQPGQTVAITCTANMDGEGIVVVVQPSQGSSTSSLGTSYVQTHVNKISSDPDFSFQKVITYALVKITQPAGGEQTFTFPQDFTGLNGNPSTQTMGKYHVFFIFSASIDLQSCCCIRKLGFDCTIFFVIPEVPFGTLVTASASFGALSIFALRKKRIN